MHEKSSKKLGVLDGSGRDFAKGGYLLTMRFSLTARV